MTALSIGRLFGRHNLPGQDENVRRVGWRLALQTVALLLVMIIALEGVVYVITASALRNSLETTLRTRATQPDPDLCGALGLDCAHGGFSGSPPPRTLQPSSSGKSRPGTSSGDTHHPQGPTNRPSPRTPLIGSLEPDSEANAIYLNRHLTIIHEDSSLSLRAPLNRSAAMSALSTGKTSCCDTNHYKGRDYLVYTAPLRHEDEIVGVVQTFISEHQYESTLSTLLRVLAIAAVLGLLISGVITGALVNRALKPIRAAMQRQRDFVADAAHELRTPLTIMRTSGEIGLAEQAIPDLQATIEQMLAENKHLTRLVEDLSLLARADTNAIAIEHQPVNLSALVADTTAEIEPLAEAQDICLDTEVEPDLWSNGDILRLRQLILILLDNALKHTPAGGTVALRLSHQGDRLRFQVVDSGPGIELADLSRIFDRFYRSDRSRSGEGTGLGLAIARWIVGVHSGEIHAGNVAPHGAVFTVTLPAQRNIPTAIVPKPVRPAL